MGRSDQSSGSGRDEVSGADRRGVGGPVDDFDFPARHHTISVRTQRLRVSIDNPGAGHPLLLINGLGATGDLFDPLRDKPGNTQ